MLRVVALAALASVAAAQTSFRVVHLNDFHARIDGITASQGSCKNVSAAAPQADLCDGGWARIFTAAREFVDEVAPTPVIFLEDGDQFMGSIWSTVYKGDEASIFLNRLCDTQVNGGAGFFACVGAIGNHEFDYGYERLAQYANNITYPMVGANMVDSCAENEVGTHAAAALGEKLKEYHIITLQDTTKVGVVGYLTPETKFISSVPSCFAITDEQAAVTAAITALQTADPTVQIIIGLGHSGYVVDKNLAAALPQLDMIVGGHTHTFLWDEASLGANPNLSGSATATTTLAVGNLYPTVVAGTPVVQAFFAGRYVGMMDLTFNSSGDLTAYTAGIRLIGNDGDNSAAAVANQVEPDAGVLALIDSLRGPLAAFSASTIGNAVVELNGDRNNLRVREMPLGNLICDAMAASMNALPGFTSDFGQVDVCIANSGGIRATIDAGPITPAEVLEVLLFGNVLNVLQMTGRQIFLALENGFARAGDVQGEFPQVSAGFEVRYNSSVVPGCGTTPTDNRYTLEPCATADPAFQVLRVVSASINGVAIANDDSRNYTVVTNNFMAGGGDNYVVMAETRNLFPLGPVLDEVVSAYITELGSVNPQTECRIVDVANRGVDCPVTSAPTAAPSKPPTPSAAAAVGVPALLLAVTVLAMAK